MHKASSKWTGLHRPRSFPDVSFEESSRARCLKVQDVAQTGDDLLEILQKGLAQSEAWHKLLSFCRLEVTLRFVTQACCGRACAECR